MNGENPKNWKEKTSRALRTWGLSIGDLRTQFPEGESALLYGVHSIKGLLQPAKQTLLFIPEEDASPTIPLGMEVKLAFPGGTAPVLLLQRTPEGLVLAPAPLRKERRKTPRVVASGFALLGREGEAQHPLRATLCDLSLGGIGLLCQEPLYGIRYHVFFQIMGELLIRGECLARVVSCRQVKRDEKGLWRVGFEFMTLPESLRAQIQQMTLPPSSSSSANPHPDKG